MGQKKKTPAAGHTRGAVGSLCWNRLKTGPHEWEGGPGADTFSNGRGAERKEQPHRGCHRAGGEERRAEALLRDGCGMRGNEKWRSRKCEEATDHRALVGRIVWVLVVKCRPSLHLPNPWLSARLHCCCSLLLTACSSLPAFKAIGLCPSFAQQFPPPLPLLHLPLLQQPCLS